MRLTPHRRSKDNLPSLSHIKVSVTSPGRLLVIIVFVEVLSNIGNNNVRRPGNALSLVTGIIAAGLYGNIGISYALPGFCFGTRVLILSVLQRWSIST